MVESAGGWEAERVFGTVAFAALGDPALMDDDEWRQGVMPLLRVRDDGLGMIFTPAEADDVPVEFFREGSEIVAARMEFVDDVAELEANGEGAWVSHGRLRIGDSGAVGLALEGSSQLSIAVELRPGWYRAESFAAKGDLLGIRLTADEEQVRTSGRVADKIVDQAKGQAHAMSGRLGISVAAVVVVHGGVTLGWFSSPTVDGVRFCSPGRLRKVITKRPVALTPEEVSAAAERILGSDRSNSSESMAVAGPPSAREPAGDPPTPAFPRLAGDVCACGGEWVERHRRSDGAAFLGCSRFLSCRRTQALT